MGITRIGGIVELIYNVSTELEESNANFMKFATHLGLPSSSMRPKIKNKCMGGAR